MKIAGIIAEYNPFHNGHLALAQEVRAAGADAVVAVMGGNWLQRGAPALLPKHQRARAALLSGVDLVVELPLPYAAATAQRFAWGGVSLLAGLGCVDTLAFGSECGDLGLLSSCAGALEEPALEEELRRRLRTGVTFAAARQGAVESLFGPRVAAPFSSPNNILAIQYLRELRRWGGDISPFTLTRQGPGHHSQGLGDPPASPGRPMASASALRARLEEGRLEETRPFLPGHSFEVLSDAFREGLWADAQRLELPLLSQLRRMGEEEFSLLPDVSEGLEHRLVSAVRSSSRLSQVLDRVKTKRYTRARLRRILLAAYLSIPAPMCQEPPPYLRILGMNRTGERILKKAKATATLPLSQSLAQLEKLGGAPARFASLESRSTDLYALLCSAPLPCGTDYTNSIIKVP